MTSKTILLPSIAPEHTRSVTLERGQYTVRVLVDDIEIMTRIKGRPWTITSDIDDLVLIADACRGAWRMIREA
ncbi:hypothetical protein Q6D67_12190 [Haliea sp. E1-2-M8]|uniref:hypothetical protein n=1 Tax=Haliea sp. E1-2-M8 TaxID=3064706 RepID=UPI0027172738|nr:hypothetical protein [Haliea sp. E1-2-M8]MDO8862461.1 hypothetical protein [Haliea sp. E1-2-M8]